MILKSLYETNRTRFLKNMRERVGELTSSIALFKGSRHFYKYETNCHHPTKYDQNFVYLFGLEEVGYDGFIEMDKGSAYLISADSLDSKPRISSSEARERFGIEAVLSRDEFKAFLNREKPNCIFINKGIDRYTNIMSNFYDDEDTLSGLQDKIDYNTSYPVLNNTRTVKSPIEIEFMRKVCMLSSRAHEYMLQRVRPGMFEYDLEAIFQEAWIKEGASDWAYWPICGSSCDCAILHYIKNTKQLEDGALSLCDMGAKQYGICADITTTFPVNGKFSLKQKAS